MVIRHRDGTFSFTELFGLPATVSLDLAAGVFGMSLSTAYRRVRLGAFPCRVTKRGRRYVITMAELLRGLGIQDVRVHPDDVEEGAAQARDA
ncbi:hypothetical protein ABZ832_18955 [Streptantibioticus parmotrematis]|uniref:hypothetical protein n=1 Tax=Streptantibioticus parmotrematis TaxID=2873249 RepID=UPI0033FBA35A